MNIQVYIARANVVLHEHIVPWIQLHKTDLKKAGAIALFMVALGLNVHYRLFPAYFPQLKGKAIEAARQRVLDEAAEQTNQKYPQYIPGANEKYVNAVFSKMIRSPQFKHMVAQEHQRLRDMYQDEDGQTYILELDGYTWMQYVRNILKRGKPGDVTKDSREYNMLMLAPLGAELVYPRFFYYASAYLFKAFTFFWQVKLHHFLFYLPLFYTLILLCFLYYIVRSAFGNIAAFFAVCYIGCNGLFVARSCVGWFDYDTLSFIFALAIPWCIIQALKTGRSRLMLIGFSILAAFVQCLYYFTWVGWWSTLLIIAVFYIIAFLNSTALRNEREPFRVIIGNIFICACVFYGCVGLMCYVFFKTNLFEMLFRHVLYDVFPLGKSVGFSIWPNTYYTVSELMPASMKKIAGTLYGNNFFLFTLVATLIVYLKEKRSKNSNFVYMMFIWLFFMLAASLKSVRFIAFLSIPLGIFFGAFMSSIFRWLFRVCTGILVARVFVCIIIVVSSMFCIAVFSGVAAHSARSMTPMMNDNWAKAFSVIRESTPKDAILNSWWDYGNLFKAYTSRRVIFDGQSQETSLAYWMGRVLISQDEKRAVRILQMLNNASDTTFTLLNKYIPDPFLACAVIDRLMSANRDQARIVLEKFLPPSSVIDQILAQLYDTPAPAYFIVEDSMLPKMASISFLGNWDIIKLYARRHASEPENMVISQLQYIFNVTPEAAKSYLDEARFYARMRDANESLSRRYKFYTYGETGNVMGNLVYFDNGFVFDLHGRKGIFHSLHERRFKIPQQIVFSEGNTTDRINFPIASSDMTIAVIKNNGKYTSFSLDSELVNSLFYRLFFLDGKGLKYFERFYVNHNSKMYIYRIKWEALDEE